MKILHISYLQNGKRVIVKPNTAGKFKIAHGSGRNSSSTLATASELVSHPEVRDSDPTLTLQDGKKYRVYHAGNSHIPLVYPSIVIENFDKSHEVKIERAKSLLQEKVRKKVSTTTRKEQTTAPMTPLIPPPPSTPFSVSLPSVQVPPPLKPDEYDFDDEDDLNDGLYDSYPYDPDPFNDYDD